MPLHLERIGRRIVNYVISRPRLNRAIDAFGKIAHKSSFGRYTPGLTREAFLLFQRTLPGDKIDIEKDGFYRKGNKIAGNEFISKRIMSNGLPMHFTRTEHDSQETISEFCRNSFYDSLLITTLKNIGFTDKDILELKEIISRIPKYIFQKLFSIKFTPQEQRIMNDEIGLLANKLGITSYQSPEIKPFSLINILKMPISLYMATLMLSRFITDSEISSALPLELGIYSVVLLHLLISSGMYVSNSFLHKMLLGSQSIYVSPSISEQTRLGTVDHEFLHHLKLDEGTIIDDRIAQSVTILRLKESGASYLGDIWNYPRFEGTLELLKENRYTRKQLMRLDNKGSLYKKSGLGETISSSYNFGEEVAAIAWWIREKTNDAEKPWEFIRLVSQGTSPMDALSDISSELSLSLS